MDVFYHILEITGVALGLLYLWLELRASTLLWPVGIVMPAIYVFVYYESGFYADAGISVYYVVASVYGWTMWLRRGNGGKRLSITHTPLRAVIPLFAVFAALFAVIAAVLINFTDSTVPIGDSFTTALSVVGLWMLARKYVEQWLVWVVVDVVSAGLYIYKGLYPTAVLYSVYTIVAVYGYFKWKHMMETDNETI